MQEKLKQLGLTYNERRVYLSLLKIGETSVGDVIKDVKAHRQSVYNALEDLEKKKLILKKKENNINRYRVRNPRSFIDNLKEKEVIAEELGKEVDKELSKNKHHHEVNVYSGRENIRRYYLNTYREMPKGSFLNVVNNEPKRFENVVGKKYLAEEHNALLLKKGIVARIITGVKRKDEFKEVLKRTDIFQNKEVRYIPDVFVYPLNTQISKEKISLLSFKRDWFVVEIKNEQMAKFYSDYFETLWNLADDEKKRKAIWSN